MNYENIGRLVDLWLHDLAFRKTLQHNPDDALQQVGISLSTDELEAIKKIDWNLSEAELKSRISKAM